MSAGEASIRLRTLSCAMITEIGRNVSLPPVWSPWWCVLTRYRIGLSVRFRICSTMPGAMSLYCESTTSTASGPDQEADVAAAPVERVHAAAQRLQREARVRLAVVVAGGRRGSRLLVGEDGRGARARRATARARGVMTAPPESG